MSKKHSTTLAALEQQQAESEALFASIGDGSIVINDQGKISRINKAALDLLGYDRDELIGRWFPEAVAAYDETGNLIDPMDRPIVQAFIEGKPIAKKIYYATKTGHRFPVAITVSPVFLGSKPIGAIEVFRDITIEHEIDRMKSEFISIASHQLRTPLTAIQTYGHLLASGFKGALSKEQHEFMDIILSSVDRMNDIISTLLDVSRIEAGKLTVDYTETDVSQLCTSIIQELQPAADEKHIKFQFEKPDKPIKAVTDQLLLAEAYANLISNAIKYTSELGTVNIVLKNDKNRIVFAVHDTGLGIPANMRGQIFTKFFRAPNVVKGDTTGTGLGLYMVKQIADTLGGRVWFDSIEHKGSTFYFRLDSKPRPTAKLNAKTDGNSV